VLVQAEDEIAAIHMIIGAAYAGVRAMTATSGGGFCLMVEGLGLAGMTETPIVVVEGQRVGTAIGLPTRTEQGDLEFIIHASHGEFPRAVLAPATVEDAFLCTVKAFNLAEKYQIPVLIVTDHHLATCYSTVEKFDLSRVVVDRGLLSDDKEPSKYKRHLITDSGISPRAFPGLGKALVVTDSDEHDEIGHPIEDAETRAKMVQKRMRKIAPLKNEIATPKVYGSQKADLTLISWGSTYGAAREAVDSLNRNKVGVNLINLNEIWPFPAEAMATLMKDAKKICVVESNATGQLAHLISAETGKKVTGKILKYDGRPITSEYIIRELNKGGLV
jgi:2-oxoglutarate/2-oxoacid ferredoxin oxidoreductase subunit alpha